MDASVDNPADDQLGGRSDGDRHDDPASAAGSDESEPFVDADQAPTVGQVPSVAELMAQAAQSAGIAVTDPPAASTATTDASTAPSGRNRPADLALAATGTPRTDEPLDPDEGDGDPFAALVISADADAATDADADDRPPFWRRRPKTTIAIGVAIVVLAYPVGAYIGALRKPGNESLTARTAEWARDMKLGFAVDWAEQKHFATDQFATGGTPDASAFQAPSTVTTLASTTKPAIPHLTPPSRMKSPVDPADPGEGEWHPIGPQPRGLPGVWVTKVRPDASHTSLTIFAAWIDPKLTSIVLHPGTDLPGGEWAAPHLVTPETCANAIMASNGGFRMDQANGGYYAEGREPFKLRDGAASLIMYKDGTVDVGLWGRDVGRDQLPQIESVRQNLGMLVDGGAPTPATKDDTDWGAKLKNVYFMWRSGYGVTAEGALVYVGGPALTPFDLATALVNAGAVRAMEGDINPEWVTAILFNSDATGCHGQKALGGPENTGGMRAADDRYLSTDTRDFVAVYAKP